MTAPQPGSVIVDWVSCGTASAVGAKLSLAKWPAATHLIARIQIDNEHPDNDRFAADLERWLGQPLITLRSDRYKDCWEVWEKRRFLSGVKGALCTTEMKRMVRHVFEQEHRPDFQMFGYAIDETSDRAAEFRAQNPDVRLLTPLIDAGLAKSDCHAMIERAGIELPAMYRLGYRNNNCIGCVKGGVGYWNKIRVDFPEVFARMGRVERMIGRTVCKMPSGDRARVYLDELSPDAGRGVPEPDIECSLLCHVAEMGISNAD